MRLTVHTDYALRLLMMLAATPDEPHTVAGVAARYGISRHHLTKVAQTLVRAGFVRAQRGRGGGLQLARPTTGISLGAVVRATEENFAPVQCFSDCAEPCVLAAACSLKSPLQEAIDAFLGTLDRYTLADMLHPPQLVQQIRGLLAGAAA